MKQQALLFTTLILASALLCAPVKAQPPAKQPSADLMPPSATGAAVTPGTDLDSETHPPLNMTPDKSELVRLDREASSVVVGNPGKITVMLDTPKLAVIIPRMPGATYFTVLDKDSNVIMQRHVIVASPKKNYVRVRRSCANAGGTSCQPTSVYYCPDMCHEVGSAGDGEDGSTSSASP